MPSVKLGDQIRNAKPTSFGVIPRGKYEATVDSAEFTTSKTGGNPMFKVTFVIDEGQEHANRKLFANIAFTDKSIDFSVAKMIALGVSQEDLAEALDGGDPDDISASIVDMPVTLVVDTRKTDEFGEQNDIKRIIPRERTGEAGERATAGTSGSRPKSPF